MRLHNLAALGSILVGGGLAVVGACTSNGTITAGNDAGGGGGEGGTPSTVWTIGVSNSLSGGLSSIGTPLHNGWSVAENLVNSSGGVLGKQLKFVELDDQSDDNTQADDGGVVTGVAKKLIAQNVAAVIGPNGSSQVLTVQGLFYNAQMLEISATATSVALSTAQPSMEDGGRFLFRTAPPDSLQGRALAYLANLGVAGVSDGGAPATTDAGGSSGGGVDAGDDGAADDGSAGAIDAAPAPDSGPSTAGVGCPSLAILYYSNAYGQPMEAVVEQKYKGQIVAKVQVASTVKSDYSAEISQITAAKPACLAMIVYDDVGDAFLLQLAKTLGVPNGPFPFMVMGTDGVYTSSFVTNGRTNPADTSSRSVVEGVYGTNPDTDPTNSSEYSYFANLYTQQFPLSAGQTGVDAYASSEFDAAMLIALAIAQAGGVSDRVKLRDALVAVSTGQAGAAKHGASDFLAALSDIEAKKPIYYSGASGPCILDANGDVQAGYIFWQVQNGNLTTLTHVPVSQLP